MNQKLKMYKKTPDKGLVVFCGALPSEDGGPWTYKYPNIGRHGQH